MPTQVPVRLILIRHHLAEVMLTRLPVEYMDTLHRALVIPTQHRVHITTQHREQAHIIIRHREPVIHTRLLANMLTQPLPQNRILRLMAHHPMPTQAPSIVLLHMEHPLTVLRNTERQAMELLNMEHPHMHIQHLPLEFQLKRVYSSSS